MKIRSFGRTDAQIRHILGSDSARIRHASGKMTRKLAIQKDLGIKKDV